MRRCLRCPLPVFRHLFDTAVLSRARFLEELLERLHPGSIILGRMLGSGRLGRQVGRDPQVPGEPFRPIRPIEQTALLQRQGQGKKLCLPRRVKMRFGGVVR